MDGAENCYTLTCLQSDAMNSAVSGVCSAGLMTTTLPRARAGASLKVNITVG